MRGLRGVVLISALAVGAAPLFAGVTYKTVTKVESGSGKMPMSQEMTVRAWISGGNAKTEMSGSGSPLFPAGSYLLKRADNAAMLMVNPGNKTYAVWDPVEMLSGVSKQVKAAFRIEDAKWEKVSEEDGGQVQGFPTEHYHYRFSYSMVVTIEGHDERAPATLDQEFWTTEKLSEPGLAEAASYQYVQQLSGLDPDIEQMLRAELAEMKGFPLKQEWTVRTTTDGDKEFVQKTSTSVSEIQQIDVPESVFVVPADYRQTQPPTFELKPAKEPEN